ncbi:uncharacterized protein LOC143206871 isoform X2 [Rhynchophorus ferrugineus]|uniref:uncharacterized protein LOC143206871 isoform X2 n=1 Tax=Rhynchophorus ferrugineus TaxID=354439 RepID=UPI003FCCFF01
MNSTSDTVTSEDSLKKKSKDTKNCGLRKCFAALVDRKQVNLELDVLILMLKKELHLSLDTYNPRLVDVLPYILVFYIKTWPGWQKSVEYYSGNIQFKVWYDKFFNFITIKLNEVITVHFKETLKQSVDEKLEEIKNKFEMGNLISKVSQTDSLALKTLSPIKIKISCKPLLLNTLVFTDNQEDDVVLKQHEVLEWEKSILESITLQQIISWPYVGVHMYCPVFSFSRRNLHDVQRFVNLVGAPLLNAKVKYIESVKIINKNLPRSCISLDCMKTIAKEFVEALSNIYKSPALDAFQTVIDEFLTDIEEINIFTNGNPSIASNTSVLFNIGKKSYFRNKKLSRGSSSRQLITYTEEVIPKMETALVNMASVEELKNYIHVLRTLDINKGIPPDHSLPQITFSCSFCKTNYTNAGLLANHFKDEHKLEQPVLCAKCKESFPIFVLTNQRWGHNCKIRI